MGTVNMERANRQKRSGREQDYKRNKLAAVVGYEDARPKALDMSFSLVSSADRCKEQLHAVH